MASSYRRLTTHDVRRIKLRLSEGASPTEIAKELGPSRQTVAKIAHKTLYADLFPNIAFAPPSKKGTKNKQAKLTAAQVTEARRLYIEHKSYAEVARVMGVNYQTIRGAITGRQYVGTGDLAPVRERLPTLAPARRSLTADQVREIRRELAEGKKPPTLAKVYGIKPYTIYAIRHSLCYRWVT